MLTTACNHAVLTPPASVLDRFCVQWEELAKEDEVLVKGVMFDEPMKR